MIVVTGGTGLLGSHLLCELALGGKNIVATYQTASKIQDVRKVFNHYFPQEGDKYFERITWKKVDLNDLMDLDELIQAGDEVYHCAALVSFHRADFNRLMKINREGTFNVVNTCLSNQASKLCYVSSTAAIGGGQEGMLSEENRWKKNKNTSAYSISKFSAEKEVWRGIEEGLNAVIVNPCVILGAGRWEDGSLSIFNHVSKKLPFYPPGANATVDARDVAKIMVILMEKEIFNERFLCIGSNQSFKTLFQTIAQKMQVKVPNRVTPNWLLYLLGSTGSLITFLSGKKMSLSMETVKSAMGKTSYSATKIEKELDFNFIPLDASVENALKGRIK